MTARACVSVNSCPDAADAAASKTAATRIVFIGAARFNRFDDQLRHFGWMREHRHMARGQCDGLRVHRLRELPLEIRGNHPVIGGDHIPGRLRLPSRVGQFRAEGCAIGRPLRGGQNFSIREGQILGKVFQDPFRGHRQEPARVRPQLCTAGSRREFLAKLSHRLARSGRERRHIDEADDLRVVAAFADHGTAVRMADKNDRAIQARDCTLGRRDVVGQGGERILDGDRIQARLFEQRDHLGPARAVGPCAMDKDDRRLASLCDDQVREGSIRTRSTAATRRVFMRSPAGARPWW